MDPLSLLAGIAGVATAGIQVSKLIYDLVSSIRGAPKEVSDIARGVSDLSIVLSELRRALKEGRKLYRRKLLRRVDSAIQRIYQVHAQIHDMIAGIKGVASIVWLFRRSKTSYLLYQIESHKNGINIILHIMTLAVQTRAFSERVAGSSGLHRDNSDGQDERAEADLSRQHAENLVQVSYQSLRDAITEQGSPAESSETDQGDEAGEVPAPDGTQTNTNIQLQVWKEGSERDNTAQWLYELVFSSYAESLSGYPTTSKTAKQDDAADLETQHEGPDRNTEGSLSRELSGPIRNPPQHIQLALMVRKPVEASSVVDELLAEWTTLTEDEIARVVEEGTDGFKPKELPLKFKDTVGRKFAFPYHLCRTWAGIKELINEAFLHVDVIGPHVLEGHYDIIGSGGEVILPSIWEHVIQPGDAVTMHMWPMDKPPPQPDLPPARVARRPVPPLPKPMIPPKIQRQSPTGPGGVETNPGGDGIGAMRPTRRQAEADKDAISGQKQKNFPTREDKQDRGGRRKPTSGTRAPSIYAPPPHPPTQN